MRKASDRFEIDTAEAPRIAAALHTAANETHAVANLVRRVEAPLVAETLRRAVATLSQTGDHLLSLHADVAERGRLLAQPESPIGGYGPTPTPPKPKRVAFDYNQAKKLVELSEGGYHHVYADPMGIPTIGIGFNLSRSDACQRLAEVHANCAAVKAGRQNLTNAQIDELYNMDLKDALNSAHELVRGFDQLVAARQFVVVDMIFNMGSGKDGFGGFHQTISDIEHHNYRQAATDMSESAWAHQVGDRAVRDIQMMRSGRFVHV